MAAWLARSRYLVLIAVVGIFLSALTTFGWALATTIDFVVDLIRSDAWEESSTIIELLEVLDLYLIGTVLLITAIGLYELFIGTVQLPEWLVIRTLGDLKRKLVEVIVLVIGIKFLEKLVTEKEAIDVLWYGLGSAAVMAVLVGWNAVRDSGGGAH
jgi:uncharacterized membrane protein YqhA